MEKRRVSVENNTVRLKLLKTLVKLGFSDDEHNLNFHIAYLEVDIQVDLSGEEWDDNYSRKDGRDTR